jgi:hypothetical protein
MESRVQSPRGLDEGSTKLLPIYLNYRRYTTQPLLFFLSEFVRSDPQNCYYNQIFVNGAIDPFLKLCVVALPRVPTRSRSLLPSSVVTRISPATSNPCAPWLAPPPPGHALVSPHTRAPDLSPSRSLLPSLTGQPPSAQPPPSPQGRFKNYY